jgi:hypothetical protein
MGFELDSLSRRFNLPRKKRKMLAENRVSFLQKNDSLNSISKFTDISEPWIGENLFLDLF